MSTESAGGAMVSADAILDKFAEIAARHLKTEEAKVTPETYLQDLGASSLDLVEITLESYSK